MYESLVLKLRTWEKAGLSNSHVFKEAADAIEELTDRNVGKWEVDEVGCGICSACRNYAFETTTHHVSGWYPRFCPNCGAKMEGVRNDV